MLYYKSIFIDFLLYFLGKLSMFLVRIVKVLKKKGIIMLVLEIKDFYVEIEGKEILKGVNLILKIGEIAVIMGLNGIGKLIFFAVIMGNLNYEVIKGEVLFDGVNIFELEVDECVCMGFFFVM